MINNYFANTGWNNDRLGKITASEVYKLMKRGRGKDQLFGDTAMTYIYEKIAEILTGETKMDLSGMAAIEWGNANEYEGIELLQKKLGIQIEIFGGSNPVFFPFNKFSGGSPDGLSEESIIEIKCPFSSSNHIGFLIASKQEIDHSEWLMSEWDNYYAQVQFNMLCTNRNSAILCSYDPRMIDEENRLAILHIEPNADFIYDLQKRITAAGSIISHSIKELENKEVALEGAEINLTKLKKL